jgi:hypothetical protein
MKKLLTILYLIVISNTYAQSPQGINYQSIIRNSAGTVLPSTAVLIEFKLYNSLSGPLVYLENHNITTNSFGMANVIIGQGTAITGSFNTINWANGIAYEVYINSNLVGTKQLFMSVPYALFSPLQPLNLSGNILSSGSTSNSVTLTSGTTYTNGAGISILSGSIITNTAPNQTVILTPGNSNITIGGAYPSYSVSSTSTLSLAGTSLSISNGNTVILPNPGASTTITPRVFPNNNVLITGASPSYTIGAPSYSITNPIGNTLVINNGINSSTLNFNPLLTGDAIGPVNSTTVVSMQGEPISAINPTPGQVLQYIGSIWTPTTLTTPTTTIVNGNNIILNQLGTTYTVSTPSYSITNPSVTNNLVITNGLNSSTVSVPSPTLGLTNGTLTVGSNTINLSNPTNGFWSVKGNLGTLAATNFIGTTDAVDLNFRTSNVNRMTISSTGNIGLGITTPTNIFTIGNVGLEKFNISSINGSMNFLDDQASITFPIAGPIAKPMIHMFASGTTNSSRMVIAHSSAFPNYGLQYEDASDRFNFIGNGNPVLTADLANLRVGVGTYTPQALFEVVGESRISGAVGKIFMKDQMTALPYTYQLYVNNGDFNIQYGAGLPNFKLNGANCYIGTGFASSGTRLTVGTSGDGSNAIANAWTVFSDRRYKDNILQITNAIGMVQSLRGVTYNWKSSGLKDIGFIAQEVEEVVPTIVFTDEKTGYKSIDYSRMAPILIEAVKEQQKMIDELKKKYLELEKELKELKNK